MISSGSIWFSLLHIFKDLDVSSLSTNFFFIALHFNLSSWSTCSNCKSVLKTSLSYVRWIEVFVVFLFIFFSFSCFKIFQNSLSMHFLQILVLNALIPHKISFILRNSTHLGIPLEIILESNKHNTKTCKRLLSFCNPPNPSDLEPRRNEHLPSFFLPSMLSWECITMSPHEGHCLWIWQWFQRQTTLLNETALIDISHWPTLRLSLGMMSRQPRPFLLQLRVIIWSYP